MQARITRPDESERVQLLGTTHIVLVNGKQTEGRFSTAILEVPPGAGVPPHVHEREDELFHVMEGEIEFFVDGKLISAGAGSTFFGPNSSRISLYRESLRATDGHRVPRRY